MTKNKAIISTLVTLAFITFSGCAGKEDDTGSDTGVEEETAADTAAAE